MIRYLLIFSCITCAGFASRAQKIPTDDYGTAGVLSPIGSAFNRIFHSQNLDSAYLKLAEVKKNKRTVFRIVHIGDSHVQAGFFPGRVRTGLQEFFGNAGRGLVFPYAAIRTSSPADINSSSNSGWKTSKLASNGDAADAGVSGYGIRTDATGANIELSLKDLSQPFDRLRFFLGNEGGSGWLLSTNNGNSLMVKPGEDHFYTSDINLETPSPGFTLSCLPSDKSHRFYGVSLENRGPGVIYHAIGVNGARYDQYNDAPLFWKQLPGLEADLYIVSLGTNEAQGHSFDEKEFRKELTLFLDKLAKASPGTPVIITTAPDSFKNGRLNKVLRDLNLFLFEYCTEKSIPVWDLYRVTNGYGSASSWRRQGFMNDDLVHFTGEGYQLQGQLFFNAFARGYNEFHGY